MTTPAKPRKITKTDPIYRVTYINTVLGNPITVRHDYTTLQKAHDYINERSKRGSGEQYRIIKIITTYEEIYHHE